MKKLTNLTKIILPIGKDSKEVVSAFRNAGISEFAVLKTLYSGIFDSYCWSGNRLFIRKGNAIFRDGELLYEMQEDENLFDLSYVGGNLIIQRGMSIIKNGRQTLFWGHYRALQTFDDEVFLILNKDTLLKNGVQPLFKVEENDYWNYSKGYLLIIRPLKNTYNHRCYLKNGKELIYEGDPDDHHWFAGDLIIRKGNSFLKNGREVISQGDYDEYHMSGGKVFLRKGNSFFEGDKLIYEGGYTSYEVSDGNLIIQDDDKLLKNGRVIYQGPPGSYLYRSVQDQIFIQTTRHSSIDNLVVHPEWTKFLAKEIFLLENH